MVAQKATIRYSNISAPWTMFSYAATNYSRSRLKDNLDSTMIHHTRDPLANFYRIITSIDSTRQEWLQYQPISLLSLLRKFRTRKASDERDKVFALLNLVRHWGPNGPLRPDYTLQPGEVWFQVAKGHNHKLGLFGCSRWDSSSHWGPEEIPILDYGLECLTTGS